MSNDTNMNNDKKSISYGAKLKAAREAMGFEQKDIAAQLRLGERIIEMLESGHYSSDVPTTFIRGYIRSYSKLLQIPDADIAAALEPIQPAPAQQDAQPVNKPLIDLTSSNYYMQFSTYAIVATLAGMLGLWWYNHTPSRSMVVQTPTQTLALSEVKNTEVKNAQDNKEVAATTPSAASAAAPAYINATNTANAATPAPTGPTVAAATPATKKLKPPTIANDDDEDDDHND